MGFQPVEAVSKPAGCLFYFLWALGLRRRSFSEGVRSAATLVAFALETGVVSTLKCRRLRFLVGRMLGMPSWGLAFPGSPLQDYCLRLAVVQVM